MEEHTHTQPQPKLAAFPDIPVLFTDAWHLFTQKLLKMFFLWLYMVGLTLGGILVFVIIAAILFFAVLAGNPMGSTQAVAAAMTPGFIGLAVVLVLALLVFMSVLNLSYTGAIFFVFDSKTDDQTTLWQYFKKGLQRAWPLYLTTLIVGLLAFGSLFVFIIPYIIILFLCMFLVNVVVLENKKGMDAIKMSVSMVSQNFGAIIGRVIMLWLAFIVVYVVLGMIGREGSDLRGFIRFVQVLLNLFGGMYSSAYMFLLYKHARAAYDEKKQSSITWIIVVAIIGWLLAGVIGYFVIKAIPESKGVKKVIEQMEEEKMVPSENMPPIEKVEGII